MCYVIVDTHLTHDDASDDDDDDCMHVLCDDDASDDDHYRIDMTIFSKSY